MAGAGRGRCVPIRPPRLEDAGLEDCALPPESIAEAFSLAAEAVSSRLARFPLSDTDSDDEGEGRIVGGCVGDGEPAPGVVPDVLVGGSGDGAADEVVVVGGWGGGGGGGQAVTGGRGEEEDRVVVVGEGRGEKKKLGKEGGCVEGVGEGVAEQPRRARADGGDEEEEVVGASEKVTLVPDFA